MKTSAQGIALLKRFEGCKLKAYRDSGGVWTIGYGHTAAAGGLVPGAGVTITQSQADDMFIADLVTYENGVSRALTRTPTRSQFDAMVSLCYNIGGGAFATSSVARLFNAGQYAKAANAFLLWNKDNGKVIPGLTRRRSEEMGVFMSKSDPVDAQTPVPAPTAPKDTKTAPQLTPQSPRGLLAALVALILSIFKRKT